MGAQGLLICLCREANAIFKNVFQSLRRTNAAQTVETVDAGYEHYNGVPMLTPAHCQKRLKWAHDHLLEGGIVY